MNKVYKTVFNKSTQTWMAVCEYARSTSGNSVSGSGQSSVKAVIGSLTALSFAVLYS
ncbi:ESPR-type extended signal peptide-containing protein [Moraxella marmotae]|uniref:ESPR-type extended signal peptide-containing protein n=1 Tax=Moraxella marmotae TaxID=3344520 RepID=UPI0035F30205